MSPVAVTLVFPCLNPKAEQWNALGEYIERLEARAPALRFTFMVVDDGSPRWTDPPPGLARRLQLVRQGRWLGKGGAIRSGASALASDVQVFAFTDFDLPFKVDDVVGVIAGVVAGADLCIGDRSGNQRSNRFSRNVAHRLFRLTMRALITGGVADTQCGLKAYDAAAARRIAGRARLSGFLFDVEWIYIALKHKLVLWSWPVELLGSHESSSLRSFKPWLLAAQLATIVKGILQGHYEDEELTRFAAAKRARAVAALSGGAPSGAP